jgi:ubiquinone/menaquinone biosynthesis C-methylase UbiE
MTQDNSSTTSAWENYWQGSQLAGTVGTGGAQDPALEQFWTHHLDQQLPTLDGVQILDVGCGSGAVIEFAQAVARAKSENPSITGIDASASAIAYIRQHYPTVNAACCDAANTSLDSESFDHVVSQFGLEYAGAGALAEMARLLRNGGTLTALMHLRDGAIDRECASDKAAISEVLDSGLFPALVHLFKVSLARRKGQGSRVGFELADKALNPPVQIVRGVLNKHGKTLANGLLHRIYADIAHMYKNMKAFDPDEVIAWSDKVEGELHIFSKRLESMSAAALDEATMTQHIALLAEHGLVISAPDTLRLGEAKEPAAWIVKGHKPAA